MAEYLEDYSKEDPTTSYKKPLIIGLSAVTLCTLLIGGGALVLNHSDKDPHDTGTETSISKAVDKSEDPKTITKENTEPVQGDSMAQQQNIPGQQENGLVTLPMPEDTSQFNSRLEDLNSNKPAQSNHPRIVDGKVSSDGMDLTISDIHTEGEYTVFKAKFTNTSDKDKPASSLQFFVGESFMGGTSADIIKSNFSGVVKPHSSAEGTIYIPQPGVDTIRYMSTNGDIFDISTK